MRDHQRAERAGVGQAAGEDFGVGNHPVAICKRHGAGIGEKADLDHLAPLAPLGERGHRTHGHRRVLGGAAGDEFQLFGRVDSWRCVGPGDHRCDTPGGGGEAGGAEAFLVPLAWFADFDTEIDDAGRERLAAAIDDPPRGTGGAGDLGRIVQHRADPVALQRQRAQSLGPRLGIDQKRIRENRRHALSCWILRIRR